MRRCTAPARALVVPLCAAAIGAGLAIGAARAGERAKAAEAK